MSSDNKLPPLAIMAIEDAIIDRGLPGFLANYDGKIFDGTDLDDMILMYQDVLTDIELGLKRLGVSLDPIGEYNDRTA